MAAFWITKITRIVKDLNGDQVEELQVINVRLQMMNFAFKRDAFCIKNDGSFELQIGAESESIKLVRFGGPLFRSLLAHFRQFLSHFLD